jgi:predicted Zn-ribbon and HTH transcriptional regulator
MRGVGEWLITMTGLFGALMILERLNKMDTNPLPEPNIKPLRQFDGKALHLISLGCRDCGFLLFTALSRASQAITCCACGKDNIEYLSRFEVEKCVIEQDKLKTKTGTLTVG